MITHRLNQLHCTVQVKTKFRNYQMLILYTDKQAILETLVFAEVHDQLNPLLPVVVIKGMDGMISLIEEFVYDRLYYCS